ncbi:hypothetical protein [Roseiarcus sp.]|uniref:hypothetical protein n=1 Tax=Roseiarcus sp. TaxID=1969460 RepID=UPI003C45C083
MDARIRGHDNGSVSSAIPACPSRGNAGSARLGSIADWWRYFLQLTLFYGDIALDIAADLLIADSERRCAAVLLRLSARRFADSDDPEPAGVSITQEDLAGAANL